MPLPTPLVVKNGSNILLRFSGGIPSPSSVTSMIDLFRVGNHVDQADRAAARYIASRALSIKIRENLLKLSAVAEIPAAAFSA